MSSCIKKLFLIPCACSAVSRQSIDTLKAVLCECKVIKWFLRSNIVSRCIIHISIMWENPQPTDKNAFDFPNISISNNLLWQKSKWKSQRPNQCNFWFYSQYIEPLEVNKCSTKYSFILTLILQRTISKEDVGFELESIETNSEDTEKGDSDTEEVLVDSLKAVSLNQAASDSDDDSEVNDNGSSEDSDIGSEDSVESVHCERILNSQKENIP